MKVHAIAGYALLVLAACGGDDGDNGGPDPGQTVHSGAVTTNQTWASAGSPHIVRGTILVQNATLTIEAGATLEFEAAALIVFSLNGRLQALGTAASPIVMRTAGQGAGRGSWKGLRFRTSTTNTLRYVTMNGCGGIDPSTFDSIPAACVALGNQYRPEEAPTITIDHLTVEEALNGGIGLYNQSRFGDGSTTLTVRTTGYAARIPLREVPRFPLGGTFESLDSNEVRITGATLTESLTLPNGVPWATEADLRIEGPNAPILTIPAGLTMRLGGALIVGENAPGGLKIGADGGPVVNLVPSLERWGGISLFSNAVDSRINDAALEHCGDVQRAVCVGIAGDFTTGIGPLVPLKNLTINNAMGVGLGFGSGGRPAPGSTNVTITGTIQRPGTHGGESGWPIAINQSPVTAIPPGHYTGNFRDFIWINQLNVRQSETWVKHDVPYYIFNWVSVGDASSPVLTIEPGVTIQGAGGAWIYVGEEAPGALRAVGTAASPITFQGLEDFPGYWGGISIFPNATASTLFDHAIVENGGGGNPLQGIFLFYVDLGPIIRNSVIRGSGLCGVIITGDPMWTTDFKAPALGNTFANNPAGDICGP